MVTTKLITSAALRTACSLIELLLFKLVVTVPQRVANGQWDYISPEAEPLKGAGPVPGVAALEVLRKDHAQHLIIAFVVWIGLLHEVVDLDLAVALLFEEGLHQAVLNEDGWRLGELARQQCQGHLLHPLFHASLPLPDGGLPQSSLVLISPNRLGKWRLTRLVIGIGKYGL